MVGLTETMFWQWKFPLQHPYHVACNIRKTSQIPTATFTYVTRNMNDSENSTATQTHILYMQHLSGHSEILKHRSCNMKISRWNTKKTAATYLEFYNIQKCLLQHREVLNATWNREYKSEASYTARRWRKLVAMALPIMIAAQSSSTNPRSPPSWPSYSPRKHYGKPSLRREQYSSARA
jgi:hypothetical protein